jgi:hypothetical protein
MLGDIWYYDISYISHINKVYLIILTSFNQLLLMSHTLFTFLQNKLP